MLLDVFGTSQPSPSKNKDKQTLRTIKAQRISSMLHHFSVSKPYQAKAQAPISMASNNPPHLSITTPFRRSPTYSPVTPPGISPVKECCSPPNAATETQLLGIDTVQAPGFWGWTTGRLLAVLNTTSQSDADEMLSGWQEQHHSHMYDEMPQLTKQEASVLAHRLGVAVREFGKVRNRLDYRLRKVVNREAMEVKGKREAEKHTRDDTINQNNMAHGEVESENMASHIEAGAKDGQAQGLGDVPLLPPSMGQAKEAS